MPTVNTIANNSDKSNRDDQTLLPYSITHFKWARLISEIKYHLYRFTAQSSAPTHASDVQMGIRARLDTWSQESAAAMDQMPDEAVVLGSLPWTTGPVTMFQCVQTVCSMPQLRHLALDRVWLQPACALIRDTKASSLGLFAIESPVESLGLLLSCHVLQCQYP